MPAVSSVLVDRRLIAAFSRRAKRVYPREYLEALFGKLRSDGTAEIHVIAHLPHYSDPDSCWLEPGQEFAVLKAVKDEAEELGMEFLGTIHSHTTNNTCIHPTECDHEFHKASGSKLLATMFIRPVRGKLRSDVEFNVPRRPLKVQTV